MKYYNYNPENYKLKAKCRICNNPVLVDKDLCLICQKYLIKLKQQKHNRKDKSKQKVLL